MKLRKKKRIDKGAPKWMVTYSDMITLVLVFFILLFSMSQLDLVKFEALQESFRNREIFDYYPSPIPEDNPTQQSEVEENGNDSSEFENSTDEKSRNDRESQTQTDQVEKDSLDNLLAEVEAFLDENNLNNVISATRTDQGVVLTLQEVILFDSASADVLEKGEPFLDKVGMLLSNIPNQVRVEGHTDSRPISNYRFPSNWELSGARASSVIRYVIDNNDISEDRFIAAGYSDTHPVVKNNSPENLSKNRRVEIVILELEQTETVR